MRFSSLFKYLKPPRGFRLTKPGRIFFGFLLCLIIISMATGNNLLYLVLAGMLAFMIVSGVESEMNLRHLELERVMPAEIYAGLPAKIGYLVRNPKNASERLVLRDLSLVRIVRLPRGDAEMLQAETLFPGRGRAHLETITIATTYPYGLFEKSISFDAAEDIIVFPQPLLYSPVASTGDHDAGSGRYTDSVSHVRPYIPGDPLSAVAWKKQHDGLVTRVFEGGAGTSGVVVLTPGPDMERKLSWATYVISELHRSGRPFGLVLNLYYSGLHVSRAHKVKILEQLALARDIRQPSLEGVPSDAKILSI